MKKLMSLMALMCLAAACGSSPSSHDLSFTIEEGVSASIAKHYATKAVDPSNWIVSCVSKSRIGTRTVKTGTWDSSLSKFVVADVPNSEDTVCYMAENGVAFATLQYDDSNAVGNKRDTSKIISNASGKITYTADTGSAVISDGSGIEQSAAEDRVNLNGEWTATCVDVRNLISNEVDSSKSCPEELANFGLFPHLVMATDSSSELKTAYGLWMSYDAYKTCGSTEGMDSKPAGWTLDSVVNPTMGDAFTWSAPFASFTADTSSDDIFDMIRGADVGGMTSYTTFQADAANAEFCTGTEDVCATKYYEAVLSDYARENAASVCWPDLRFDWTGDAVNAYAMEDTGSRTRPLSRYAFAEAFKNGTETYIRSFESEIRTVSIDSESTQCVVDSEMLVAIVTPGGDPQNGHAVIAPGADPTGGIISSGTSCEMSLLSKSRVASVAGTSAADTLCQSYLGSSDEKLAQGFVAKAEMVMINPLPTP